jgi:hypothetical protein
MCNVKILLVGEKYKVIAQIRRGSVKACDDV